MRKLTKTKGYMPHLVLTNTETKKAINIDTSKVCKVRDILKDKGYDVPDVTDEWNIELTEEAAKEIAHTALNMNRPVRTKKDDSKPKKKHPVDILDIIYGVNKEKEVI